MNWILFRKEWKTNLKLFLIFIGVLTMYGSMIIAMFDPKLGDSLNEMATSMPQLFSAFGMANVGSTLMDFIANYLYNFLYVAFPSVYLIILSNRLVAKYVDGGSMAYLLATPHTRKTIVFTQLKVISSSLLALVVLISGICWGLSEVMFPGELDLKQFLLVNVGLYGLLIFLSGVCFCASCIFNETKYSYGIGAGLVIAFLLLQMVSEVGDKFAFLKYATPLTLFDTEGLIAGDISAIFMFLALYIGGIALYFIGVAVFSRRDLPI